MYGPEGIVKGSGWADLMPLPLRCVVCAISPAPGRGRGAAYLGSSARAHGWTLVSEHRVDDRVAAIRTLVLEVVERGDVDVLLLSGGSGIMADDLTPDAVVPLFNKRLPGFGEVYRQLAYASVGPQVVLSRADAGIIARTLVLLLPGSQAGCALAMAPLVVPFVEYAVAQRSQGLTAAEPG